MDHYDYSNFSGRSLALFWSELLQAASGNETNTPTENKTRFERDRNNLTLINTFPLLSSTMGFRKKQQAPPLVYDPTAHREFVTGFRRRKEARRKSAAESATEAEKEARRQARREKREVFRTKIVESEEEVQEDEREEVCYTGEGDVVVTASITPLESGFDRIGKGGKDKEGTKGRKDEKADGRKVGKPGTGRGEERAGGRVGDGVGKRVATSQIGKVRKAKGGRSHRVSYTHMLSNRNKRKAQLRRRNERKLI